MDVDVSLAFIDPDGDDLAYTVSSSAPQVVAVLAVGARLTLTAVARGAATIRVTATDPGGLIATQLFTVTFRSGAAVGAARVRTGTPDSARVNGFRMPAIGFPSWPPTGAVAGGLAVTPEAPGQLDSLQALRRCPVKRACGSAFVDAVAHRYT